MTLDYADLQTALKASRGKLTLRAKLETIDGKWRVAREMLAKAERICAQTEQYTADSPSRQWAEVARVSYLAMIDGCRDELTAILSGSAARVTRNTNDPAERITQAALF